MNYSAITFGLLLCVCLLVSGCIIDGGTGFDGNPLSCEPHFESERACESSCDASTVVIINGNAYCTPQCNFRDECPVNHVCVRFGDDDVPSSACLPPCGQGSDCPDDFLGLCGFEGVCGI